MSQGHLSPAFWVAETYHRATRFKRVSDLTGSFDPPAKKAETWLMKKSKEGPDGASIIDVADAILTGCRGRTIGETMNPCAVEAASSMRPIAFMSAK